MRLTITYDTEQDDDVLEPVEDFGLTGIETLWVEVEGDTYRFDMANIANVTFDRGEP